MAKKMSQSDFILRAQNIHGKKYDYSEVEYKNSITKIKVICPEHGAFYVRPIDHIHHKTGCSVCAGTNKSNTEEFIRKAKEKYGEKYDYSKIEYKNNKTKVCIICHEVDEFGNEHGEFWQRPNDHLSGYECKKCKNKYTPTTEEWIQKAIKVHGNNYDYSKVNYKDAKSKICIICPIHGEFYQIPNNHLNGCGCPNCNSNKKSKMEEGIAQMLDGLGYQYTRQKTFKWLIHNRNLFLDFYIPYKKIAIEVQGDQHFRSIKRFGGEEYLELQKERDYTKKRLCEEHGIKLFYITKKNYNLTEVLNYINNGSTNKE